MRVLRVVGIALAAVVGIGFALAAVARFSDGPLGPFAGGALRAGEWVKAPPEEWTFAAEVQEIELQLVDPPRARTTWILVSDGSAYVPCGFTDFGLWKKWPREAEQDGRAIVRFGGRRYPVELERVRDPALLDVLRQDIARKYPAASFEADAPDLWFFRVKPRPGPAPGDRVGD